MARFKVLRGKHVEDGVIYSPGQIVDSKSDLSKLNAPGAQKFEKLGEDPKKALSKQQERGRSTTPEDEEVIPVTFPGGQVSTGIQGAPVPAPVPMGYKEADQPKQGTVAFVKQEKDRQQKEGGEKSTSDSGSDDDAKYQADLEKMTVPELRKHAEDEKVDLKGAHTKADIIKALTAK